MDSYNIIKILSNIFISNNYVIDNEFIKNNSINTVIFINYNGNNNENNNENNNRQLESYDKINILIPSNINFDETNELITNTLLKSNNILIISNKNLIGFVIICAFMINNLGITFFQILLLDKIYNVQINKTIYYKLLNLYYNQKKNLL